MAKPQYRCKGCGGFFDEDAISHHHSVVDGTGLRACGPMHYIGQPSPTLAELLTPPYRRGDKQGIQAVDTPLGRIGVMICADCFLEEHRKLMGRCKPDWVWIPYGWAAKKTAWPGHGKELHNVVSRTARQAGAPVVGPNSVGRITTGPWRGRTYEGLSAVADASGTIIAVGQHNRQHLFTVQIDRSTK